MVEQREPIYTRPEQVAEGEIIVHPAQYETLKKYFEKQRKGSKLREDPFEHPFGIRLSIEEAIEEYIKKGVHSEDFYIIISGEAYQILGEEMGVSTTQTIKVNGVRIHHREQHVTGKLVDIRIMSEEKRKQNACTRMHFNSVVNGDLNFLTEYNSEWTG